jgi:CheY-like chemotaxis protein
MRVVVADKDEKRRSQVVRSLIDLGHHVDGYFDNGPEAVEFARDKRPDIVLISCKIFHNATVSELDRIGIPASSFDDVNMDVILSDMRSELFTSRVLEETRDKMREIIGNQQRILFGLLVGVSFAATIILLLIRR